VRGRRARKPGSGIVTYSVDTLTDKFSPIVHTLLLSGLAFPKMATEQLIRVHCKKKNLENFS